MAAKFAVGIDLGTTNTVLAYAPLESDPPDIFVLPIPQLVGPGEVQSRTQLPSFCYLATEEEISADLTNLPWEARLPFAIGEFARSRGAEVPARTIAAAKSWLCHRGVDRRQAILPWGAPEETAKVSPVEVSARYLRHLVQAWQAEFPSDPLAQQQVVLTVPASFDASSRDLTREAALQAGLPDTMVLLEEPQAALYAWLADRHDSWRQQVKPGDILLVCDIGGGTSDFTLISVAESSGDLELVRLAVGNHLLVGGDNMDLALAYHVSGRFQEQGLSLDPWQTIGLWHACRNAKEALLSEGGPMSHKVTVLGRGSKLIKGKVTQEVQKQEVADLLLNGFFPACAFKDSPAAPRPSGFRELGLPYEQDVAITRHLAKFLREQSPQPEKPRGPTHLLLNGGTLKAGAIAQRIIDTLAAWFPKQAAPQCLLGDSGLDFAVAKGAAHYACVKHRGGMRIRGGTARSYYVGVESAGLAIPGAPRPLRALCVVPFGMEEGTQADVPTPPVGLTVGEKARFRFFASAVRKQDLPGQLLSAWTEDELVETDPLEVTLPPAKDANDDFVPVRFRSHITELGVFELWCHSTHSQEEWKLEFNVRESSE